MNARTRSDNRPPAHLRTLRRGDVNADGKVFLQYSPEMINGEMWITPEKMNEYRLSHRRRNACYKKTSKGKSAQSRYETKRLRNNGSFKAGRKVRDCIRAAMKRGTGIARAENYLGCTIDEYRKHLESQFTEGMTWENYGEWHVDHIKPSSSFDLTIQEEVLKCFHFTNTQPLWAEDNRNKSNNH
jgi:hypothetical protein